MQQTVLGAAYTLSCHPEDGHYEIHHPPAAAEGDHPNQGHLQEVQGQLGGKVYVKYKQPYVMVLQSLCLRNLHSSEHCVGKLKTQF